MKEINVIFDSAYDDVDIISVPDFICEDLETFDDMFTDAIYEKTGSFACETEDFVAWLNENYVGEQKVSIIRQHTLLNPRLKSVHF